MAASGRRAKRQKTFRESDQLGAMVRRMFRALVRRSGEGDLIALEELAALRADVDQALADAARQMHDGVGYSWQMIGDAIGTSRQNAQQMARKGQPAAVTS